MTAEGSSAPLNSRALHDFATWAPVLRLLRDNGPAEHDGPTERAAGRIGRGSWSLPLRRRVPPPGRAAQAEDMRDETEAVKRVGRALVDAGVDDVSFSARMSPDGPASIRLFGQSPAVESGIGTAQPGALLLVEGAVAEPWRRLPDPVPGAVPAPSADPALLERTLRERLPDAVGATEKEIAAAETRLGVALPEELKALYRVTRARWEDAGDDQDAWVRESIAVRCELFPLDELYVADAASRPGPWEFAAMRAVVTPPDAAVQGLVGSPGWIVFGDNGGGDRIAIDLTPGPGGHVGQIIMIGHEDYIGAGLIADSLTDLILDRPVRRRGGPAEDRPPAVAHVNVRSLPSVEAAAHPGLEVLSIGVWEAEPVSLAPVVGLPRLRTLSAYPGTLADPLEIAGLTALEYLELGPEEWRVLLDAGAVPRSLSAAAIEVRGNRDPLPTWPSPTRSWLSGTAPRSSRPSWKATWGPWPRPRSTRSPQSGGEGTARRCSSPFVLRLAARRRFASRTVRCPTHCEPVYGRGAASSQGRPRPCRPGLAGGAPRVRPRPGPRPVHGTAPVVRDGRMRSVPGLRTGLAG